MLNEKDIDINYGNGLLFRIYQKNPELVQYILDCLKDATLICLKEYDNAKTIPSIYVLGKAMPILGEKFKVGFNTIFSNIRYSEKSKAFNSLLGFGLYFVVNGASNSPIKFREKLNFREKWGMDETGMVLYQRVS